MQNTADRLEAELVELSLRMNAAEYQMLKRIRELEDVICLIDWTYPQWLAWRLNMAAKTAFERVRVARALGSLPLISKAFEDGRLSYSKVRVLTRTATPETDATYRDYALVMSVHQLEVLAAKHRRFSTGDAERHTRERFFQLVEDEDGSFIVKGRLAPDDAAILMTALDAADAEQARVDALVEVATAAIDRLATGDEVRLHVELGHMELGHMEIGQVEIGQVEIGQVEIGAVETGNVKTEGAGAGSVKTGAVGTGSVEAGALETGNVELEGMENLRVETGLRILRRETESTALVEGIAIPRATAERLCCENPRRRRISHPQRRLLKQCQGGVCAFPGCTHRRFLQGHHVKFWSQGGATTLANLVLICGKHHRLLHEGRWTMAHDVSVRNAYGILIPHTPQSTKADEPLSPATDPRGRDVWDGDSVDWDVALEPLLDAAG